MAEKKNNIVIRFLMAFSWFVIVSALIAAVAYYLAKITSEESPAMRLLEPPGLKTLELKEKSDG
jgi:hypothetical protein